MVALTFAVSLAILSFEAALIASSNPFAPLDIVIPALSRALATLLPPARLGTPFPAFLSRFPKLPNAFSISLNWRAVIALVANKLSASSFIAFGSPLSHQRPTKLLAPTLLRIFEPPIAVFMPLNAPLTPSDITLPTTGIMAINDKNPSKYFSLQKYIIALITSNASPIIGIKPAKSNTVCNVSSHGISLGLSNVLFGCSA